jgi:formylglycine-generating enzyme required for sulfatase activity/serine/threonine protein kinase
VGNRPVALKVLSRKLLDDPDFLLRFQNEAASTGRIHHPNVVTIHESGQADDGTPYIAMEFLEGESLGQALARRGQLPVPEVAEILQQTARGLNAAHMLGIIHRDLKPDNIFLTYPDDESVAPVSPPATVQVKIVDFGIAKLRESGAHTQTGTVLGTPAYMSFEQASGMRSDELDARSDVYSLGVVVYEMLTGRKPFHSDTDIGYLRKHMMEEPPPFRTAAPGLPVPPQVEAVVMSALKKEREDRYQSALEFAHAFGAAAQSASPEEVSQPFPTTKVVRPLADREPIAPVPLPANAHARRDKTIQTPPSAPPRGIAESPSAKPQRRKFFATASHQPAAGRPPEMRTVPKSPSKRKFAGIVGVTLIVIVAGVWYFSHERAKRGDVSWSAKAGETKGEVRVNPNDGQKYVWIPPGNFQMGCSPGDSECENKEKPPHQVTITKGLWLGQTEVTVGAYKRFTGSTGGAMPTAPDFNPSWSHEQMPMVNVSWDDAQAYCAWAGGRLPTEAEWEYAARAGSTEARYGSLEEVAWDGPNSGGQTHPVGQKPANGFGLYDELGNVWEWVNDWYDEKYYQNSPYQDPAGPASGQMHVLRGGSWTSDPWMVRVSFRSGATQAGYNILGVRCAGEAVGP